MLEIYAGKNALETIQEHGFNQALFTNFLGASGGPKWFCLFGLDKYLFGDFFKDRDTELNLIGSSAGAFRAACFAQKDPVAAIERLADKYSHTVYSEKPDLAEITKTAIDLLDFVFGKKGPDEIINNEIFKAHFIVAKSNGLVGFENKIIQMAGLFSSILLNKIDRRLLNVQYERYVYHSPLSTTKIDDPYKLNTQYIDLNVNNIRKALLASGSIPYVMEGIKNIPGSPKGMYRDGGIIDYHFDFLLENTSKNINNNINNLTLYPHFNASPKAGWFDKNSSRKVLSKNYENVVLLAPSKKFIASLPFQKIPDRNDFKNIDADTRIKYWQTVLRETDKLADHFNDFLVKQNISKIKPLVF